MAQIRSLMELADLGFVIAFRFYGRYPETGRTFYHPPPCESDRAHTEVAASHHGRRNSPATRPCLPNQSAPTFSVLFSSGANQHYFGGVVSSPAPQNVGHTDVGASTFPMKSMIIAG